jgi:hypothetical protein
MFVLYDIIVLSHFEAGLKQIVLHIAYIFRVTKHLPDRVSDKVI